MDKFRRVVGILLIIIGVVIIGDVAYKKIITLKKQKEIVELFENGFSEGTSTERGYWVKWIGKFRWNKWI